MEHHVYNRRINYYFHVYSVYELHKQEILSEMPSVGQKEAKPKETNISRKNLMVKQPQDFKSSRKLMTPTPEGRRIAFVLHTR